MDATFSETIEVIGWETDTINLVGGFMRNVLAYGAHGGVVNLGDLSVCSERYKILVEKVVPLIRLWSGPVGYVINVSDITSEGDQYCASVFFEKREKSDN